MCFLSAALGQSSILVILILCAVICVVRSCAHPFQVVRLREVERHLHLRCEELELHVGELEVVLKEMESSMQRLAMDADGRLTQQSRDHQNNIQLLLKKLQGEETLSAWKSV